MIWKTSKLSEISKIGDGAHASLKRIESGIPYLTAKNIAKSGVDYTHIDYISEETYNKYFKEESNALTQPRKDDILYSIIGSIGGVYVVKDEKIGISSSVAIFRANTKIIIPQYLAYFLRSESFDAQVQAIRGGVAQGFMSLEKLGTVTISYPHDVNCQKRIADILYTYDSLIEINQKQIKLLEESAQRLYKEWFVDLRFPGYEDCKIVDGVPEGWNKMFLSEMADVTMGQSPKSEFYNQEKTGLPFHQGVGSYGTRFVIDGVYSASVTKIAEGNSILFSVRAPVGRLNITKNRIVIGRGIAAINNKKGHQSFTFYMLKERFFKDDILGNGAIFASISKDELLSQRFMIPEDKVIEKFEKMTIAIDNKIEILDIQIKKLAEIKKRLLPKLMNGVIEV